METAPSLDDQLKAAEIEKTLAESRKLEREAVAAERQIRTGFWADVIKIVGGLLLGAGGVYAAWTQFEVAEVKAELATLKLAMAEQRNASAMATLRVSEAKLKSAQVAQANVDAATKEAVSRRDAAILQLETASLALKQVEKQLEIRTTQLAGAQQAAREARSTLQVEVMRGLQPEARALATTLLSEAKAAGIDLRLIAGYRSLEKQAELVARRVSLARISTHNTGLAFDIAIIENGKLLMASPKYETVGQIGKRLGLIWGGDWKAIRDVPHFETTGARDAAAKLRSASS